MTHYRPRPAIMRINLSVTIFQCVLFSALCLGAFSILGVSTSSPVSLHYIGIPFVFLSALLLCGFSDSLSVIRSRLFWLVLPFLFVSFVLPFLGVILGYGSPHLVAAAYFSSLFPLMLILLGCMLWSDLDFGGSLKLVVACSILINSLVALGQISSVYFGVELPVISLLVESQFDIRVALNESYNIHGRATGVFINPNDFGFWAVIMIGYVWLYFTMPATKYASVFVLLLCLFASNSRGALVAFIFGLIVVAFIYRRSYKFSFIVFPSFFVMLAVFFILAFPGDVSLSIPHSDPLSAFFSRLYSLVNLVGGLGGDESLEGRLSAWRHAVNVMQEYPLGTMVPPETILGVAADNQYVYLALQGGLLMLVLYGWMLFGGMRLFFLYDFKYLLWCTLVMAIFGLSAYPLNSNAIILYWLFLGGAISILRRKREVSHV